MKKQIDYSFLIPLALLLAFIAIGLAGCAKTNKCKGMQIEVLILPSHTLHPGVPSICNVVMHRNDRFEKVDANNRLYTKHGFLFRSDVISYKILKDNIPYDETTMGCPTCELDMFMLTPQVNYVCSY
jgi:hypothetical protein